MGGPSLREKADRFVNIIASSFVSKASTLPERAQFRAQLRQAFAHLKLQKPKLQQLLEKNFDEYEQTVWDQCSQSLKSSSEETKAKSEQRPDVLDDDTVKSLIERCIESGDDRQTAFSEACLAPTLRSCAKVDLPRIVPEISSSVGEIIAVCNKPYDNDRVSDVTSRMISFIDNVDTSSESFTEQLRCFTDVCAMDIQMCLSSGSASSGSILKCQRALAHLLAMDRSVTLASVSSRLSNELCPSNKHFALLCYTTVFVGRHGVDVAPLQEVCKVVQRALERNSFSQLELLQLAILLRCCRDSAHWALAKPFLALPLPEQISGWSCGSMTTLKDLVDAEVVSDDLIQARIDIMMGGKEPELDTEMNDDAGFFVDVVGDKYLHEDEQPAMSMDEKLPEVGLMLSEGEDDDDMDDSEPETKRLKVH